MTTLDPLTQRPSSNAWHLRVRRHFVPLSELLPGTLVPPRRHWTDGLGQLVLSVAQSGPASAFAEVSLYDYDADETYQKTVHVSWGLACPELPEPAPENLQVPGAPPYATDWTKAARFPLASELTEGDVLPQAMATVPAGLQSVAALSLNYDGRIIVVLRDDRTTRRYTYRPEDAVVFPRLEDRPVPDTATTGERLESRFRAVQNARVHAWKRHPGTGQVFRFIEHPYGRGKWPTFIPPWHPDMVHAEGRPITVRRPTLRQVPDYQQQLHDIPQDEVDTYQAQVDHVQDLGRITHATSD
jgi:hypothetical protein